MRDHVWKRELLCLTFFRDGDTRAVGAWAGESFLEINFWFCAGWDCWLRDDSCLWLEIALPKTISAPQVVANLPLIFPAYKAPHMKLLSLAIVKQTCGQAGYWKLHPGSALSCIYFLTTRLPKKGRDISWIPVFPLYCTIQVALRQLKENRQKINITASASTVFSESNHKPLLGSCIFPF